MKWVSAGFLVVTRSFHSEEEVVDAHPPSFLESNLIHLSLQSPYKEHILPLFINLFFFSCAPKPFCFLHTKSFEFPGFLYLNSLVHRLHILSSSLCVSSNIHIPYAALISICPDNAYGLPLLLCVKLEVFSVTLSQAFCAFSFEWLTNH